MLLKDLNSVYMYNCHSHKLKKLDGVTRVYIIFANVTNAVVIERVHFWLSGREPIFGIMFYM